MCCPYILHVIYTISIPFSSTDVESAFHSSPRFYCSSRFRRLKTFGPNLCNITMEDDMDTPEEVTLVKGKEEASNLRKTERENRIRVAVEAKKRRKQKAAKKEELQLQLKATDKPAGLNEEHQQEIDSQDKSRSKESSDPMSAEDQLSFGSAKKDGMLPDSIVNFLAGREKHLQLSSAGTDDNRVASTLKPKKKKIRIKQNGNGTGRVQVVVLKDLFPSERVQNAKQFLQERQSHVRRSTSMLKHLK